MDTFLVKLGIGLSSSCEPLRACTRTCNATRRQLGYVPAVGHVMVLAADVVSVRIPARASRFLCFHRRLKRARSAPEAPARRAPTCTILSHTMSVQPHHVLDRVFPTRCSQQRTRAKLAYWFNQTTPMEKGGVQMKHVMRVNPNPSSLVRPRRVCARQSSASRLRTRTKCV